MQSLTLHNPKIYGRMYYSFPLSIISGHEQYEHWFYSNFIQLQSSDNALTMQRGAADFRFFHTSTPLCYPDALQVERLSRSEYIHRDLAQFITENIDLQKYVYAYVDKFHVSDNPFSQKRHYLQETFVYGYDSSEAAFQIIGFNKDRMFSSSIVPCHEIVQGIQSVDDEKFHSLYLLKPKAQLPAHLDLKAVYGLMEDYLQSRNTYQCMQCRLDNDHLVFGLDTYEMIELSFRLTMEDPRTIVTNIATSHILWEHKKMMLWRMQYMAERQLISKDEELLHGFEELIQTVDFIRHKLIKFEVTHNKKLIHQVISSLLSVREKERALLGRSMSLLECYI